MHLNGLIGLMKNDLKFYNKQKANLVSNTFICSVVNVNEEKFMVDVFIPSTSSKINNVIVGIGAVSEFGTTISTLPTVDQKGIVLISTSHSPILIAMIPNKRNDNNNSLLSGELLLGNKDTMLKVCKDNSAVVKTPTSIFTLNNNEQKVISNKITTLSTGYTKKEGTSSSGFSEELFYQTTNKNYVKHKKLILNGAKINLDIKGEIIDDGRRLLSDLSSMVSLVKETQSAIDFGSIESIEKLDELKDKINDFGIKKSGYSLKVQKGFNESENNMYKVSVYSDSKELSSMEFKNTGEVIIKCKDLVIDKEVLLDE